MPAKPASSKAMFRWNSRTAMAAFLLTLVSTDAVFGGKLQVPHARLLKSDDSIHGDSKQLSEIIGRKTQDLQSDELSSLSALADLKSSDSEQKREHRAVDSSQEIIGNHTVDENIIRAGKQKLKEEETIKEAMGAIAYVAGAAASFLTRPIINTLPPGVNKAIVGIASLINSLSKNTTMDMPDNSTVESYNSTKFSRQAREFPAYGFDGAISTAAAWLNGESVNRMDSIAPSYEERAPYASLRGPEAARLGVVDPLLTVIGVIRRAIATEFLATAVVMTVAHLTRLFVVNLPTIVPILGMSPRIDGHPELVSPDTRMTAQGSPEEDPNIKIGQDTVKRAELLAREIVSAVTRDQCAERAACLMGAHCAQYRLTPTVMRMLRSPEPEKDKPNHPVWIAFRNAAEGSTLSDNCDLMYQC